MKIVLVSAPQGREKMGPDRADFSLSRGLQVKEHDVELVGIGASDSFTSDGGVPFRRFAASTPFNLLHSPGLSRYLRDNPAEVYQHRGIGSRTLHYVHTGAMSRGIPFIISPRRLSETRKIRNSAWSAKFERNLIFPRAYEAASGWHVASEKEAGYIRDAGYRQPICVTPPGIDLPSEQQLQIAREFWAERLSLDGNRQIALFHGPLHSRKRIVELMDIWRVRATSDWLLLIVGFEDQFSMAQIENHILREGMQSNIVLVEGSYKPPPYAIANLFVSADFPDSNSTSTLEAMAAGLPVVTSNTHRWGDLNTRNAGWCVDFSKFGDALSAALQESSTLLSRRGRLAQDWISADLSWSRVAARLTDFYREIRNSK